MQQRHKNREQYYKEQGITTSKYLIPYVEKHMPINPDSRILEVGCGFGGNLAPFMDRGCEVVGIDLGEHLIKLGKEFLAKYYPSTNAQLVCSDIYDTDAETFGTFDLIFMKDVIEHIPNQEKFLAFVKQFLKPNGHIFFAFPPWRMPFGGHQQVMNHKIASKIPYTHLLPNPLYKGFMKAFGESQVKIDNLMFIKETGISINRFEGIMQKEGYICDQRDLYLINPNYEVKFGLQPRKLNTLVAGLPHFRDFATTCFYGLYHQPS